MEPFKFPIIFRFHDLVVPAGLEALRYWELTHFKENIYFSKESIHMDEEFKWILDSDAKLRMAKRIGTKNSWARAIRYIWVFSKAIYEFEKGRNITVGELHKLLEKTNKNPEKSSAKDFISYLKGFNNEQIFTAHMFREFMGENGSGEVYYPQKI